MQVLARAAFDSLIAAIRTYIDSGPPEEGTDDRARYDAMCSAAASLADAVRPVGESCGDRCWKHCPPTNPNKFSNCLVSCANGQGYACYS